MAQFNLKDIFFNLKKSQFVVKMVKNHLVLCETISSRTICIINTNMILTLAQKKCWKRWKSSRTDGCSYVKREFVSSVSWLLYRLDNVSLTVSVKWDDCFVLRISTVTYLLDFLELKKHPSNWISCVAHSIIQTGSKQLLHIFYLKWGIKERKRCDFASPAYIHIITVQRMTLIAEHSWRYIDKLCTSF